MKIYVSGKITGMSEADSRALFGCGCSIVECCGHESINPWMVNEYMAGASYEELMQEDLRIIRDEADALFVLQNYHTSAGAHREIEAQQLTLKKRDFNVDYLIEELFQIFSLNKKNNDVQLVVKKTDDARNLFIFSDLVRVS